MIGPRRPNDGPDGRPIPKIRRPKRERGGRIIWRRARYDPALQNFCKGVNPDEFHAACEISEDPRFTTLAAAMMAPGQLKCLATLTREHNITLAELYEFWRSYQHTAGMMRVMNLVPEVYGTVAEDAISRDYKCDHCEGKGKVAVRVLKKGLKPSEADINDDANVDLHTKSCSFCHGTGHVRVMGDPKARDLVFEATGLKKGSGFTFAQQVNIGTGESLESMVATASKVLAPKPRVIDVTPPEDTP